ncbi:glycosyltransferase family 2 protein [uncultured Traorella sp.]|uniref:glycosyltransferase family 2 protein n=1 Tax=uncultured Traorella sp. TaxID=1929048 RepID=UPI0025DF429E|nr:glycosyltransferase family 2 protein [uncultured Traorella sp.]
MIKHSSKEIQILKVRLVGLANPKLCFLYKSKKSSPDFYLTIDGSRSDYNLMKLISEDEYMFEVIFPRNAKKIELYVNEDGKTKNLLRLNNHFILRLFSKLEELPHKIYLHAKHFFTVLFQFIVLIWKQHHFLVPVKLWRKYFYDFRITLRSAGNSLFYNPFVQSDYLSWLSKQKSEKDLEPLSYRPLISILIPVYNVGEKILSECLDSILNQSYSNFEICLADDCSTKKETLNTLKRYEKKDSRVKVVYRKTNGHISAATNSALNIAKGEFIALVDNDDVLDKNALYENILALNKDKHIDFIYSDEDKLDFNGRRCDPHFKPDYSPDTLLSLNYICHFSVIRKKLVEEVGGFELGMEGAQDYDLFLKIVEKTNRIHHIPKILYHWRMVEGSTSASMDNKDYASDKGKLAIENALIRRNIKGHVEIDSKSLYYCVVYEYEEPLVSIIIPTKDHADITERCLQSIYEKTTYKNFEILLVNNRSIEQETYELFDKYTKMYSNFKVIDADMEFNYSKINNLAVNQSKGDVIVLLNNDTEVITSDWLKIMVGYALQPHVGAVGAKLLYPDMTVQHAGIILGLGGVASHAYIGSSRDDVGAYGRLRVPYNYSGVTAACLVIRKSVFNEVGQLEKDLSVAYNDVDLNLKLLEAGYLNVLVPQVELLHYESKSRGSDTTSEKYKRFLLEQEYMYSKWKSKVRSDRFYNANFSYKGWFVLDKD